MDKLTLEFEWENDAKFEVTSQLNDDDAVTVLLIEENGCIEGLWAGIEGILHTFLSQQLKHIGEEMKE